MAISRTEYKGPIYRLWREQKRRCYYCDRSIFMIGSECHPLFATIDHRHPQGKEGPNSRDNLAAACHQCNEMKNNMDEAEFHMLLVQHGGDIDSLTAALRGDDVAAFWFFRSTQPIPEQPPEPLEFDCEKEVRIKEIGNTIMRDKLAGVFGLVPE